MKAVQTWARVMGLVLAIAGMLMGTGALAFSPIGQDERPDAELSSRIPHDAYGNPVYDRQGHRINYPDQAYGFTSAELDSNGAVVATRPRPVSRFEPSKQSPVLDPSTALSSQQGIESEFLAQKWKTGIWGTGIGASKITVLDLDEDGAREIVLGGGSGSGANRFWYILSYSPATGSYEQAWLSRRYGTDINRIVVGDGTGDGQYEICVALGNGQVEIYDASTHAVLHTLDTVLNTIAAMAIADVDADADQELVVCNSSNIAIYDAQTWQLEWQTSAYGADDIAVANVDADAAMEMVTTRYVIDGETHALEWDYGATFGFIVQLSDIDGDSMAEIVAASGWYWVRAFDADTQSIKWELPTDLDVDALRVGDVDGDGVQEVLYGDGQWGSIHCYDSVTLEQEWHISNPEHGVTDINWGDADDDGTVEVFWGAGWGSSGGDYLFVGNTVSHQIEWHSTDVGGPLSALDVDDVDSDGTEEIVMVSYDSDSGYDDGIILVYNAETWELEWQSEPVLGGYAWTGVHALQVANIDDDQAMEIVIATAYLYDGVILAYDGVSHELEWQTVHYGATGFYALAIADVDNDGEIEVLGGQGDEYTGAEGVYVCVFDGRSGTEEWHTLDLGSWVTVYNIDVADSDGDGNPEIVFGVGGHAYIYDGVTQAQEWQSGLTGVRAVAVLDVDDDDEQEIVAGTAGGMLYAFSGVTFAQEWADPVSSRGINSIRLSDMDHDGALEIVLTDSRFLAVHDAASRDLIWQSESLGASSVGNGGHLVVRDIDSDTRDEVVVGSDYALYVFTFDLLPYSAAKEVDLALARPGDRIDYSMEMTNLSADALPVTMTDVLPTYTSYLTDSLWASGGNWGIAGDLITWTIAPEAGEQVSLTFGVTIEPGIPDGYEIVNTAAYAAGGFAVTRSASTRIDALPPTSVIVHPAAGEIVSGALYRIDGTATDTVSGVDRVEVSLDDGSWQTATGTTSWVYSWTLPMTDSLVTIGARATDGVGTVEDPGPSVTVLVDNLSPYLVSTSPAHGSTGVLLTRPILLIFSEPIVTDTLEFTCLPDPGGWSMTVDGDGTAFTLSHSDFSPNEMYSCVVSRAEDRAGHDLVEGLVPNPWAFVTGSESFAVYLPVMLR
jgi:uncharacterized repeat protein (TIGR01451 family)